jgi:hypothetical protein
MGWISVVNTFIFNLQWVLGDRMRPLDIFLAVLWPAFVLLQLLSMRFIYWETDEQAIHEHRFGKNKLVPFSEILRVTANAEWSGKVSQLRIEYASSADPSKRRRIRPNPTNIAGLVDVLRQRASSAAIEV